MAKILIEKERPVYEVRVFPYADRLVCHVSCNLCHEKFMLSLRANKYALNAIPENTLKNIILKKCAEKHSCPPESYRENKTETQKIITAYGETKNLALKFGLTDEKDFRKKKTEEQFKILDNARKIK